MRNSPYPLPQYIPISQVKENLAALVSLIREKHGDDPELTPLLKQADEAYQKLGAISSEVLNLTGNLASLVRLEEGYKNEEANKVLISSRNVMKTLG